MKTFDEVYREAIGFESHEYQSRKARDGLPDVARAPSCTGKTGVMSALDTRPAPPTPPMGTERRPQRRAIHARLRSDQKKTRPQWDRVSYRFILAAHQPADRWRADVPAASQTRVRRPRLQ